MQAPSWATHHGVHGAGFTMYISKEKFLILEEGGDFRDEGTNGFPLQEWNDCGWSFTEIKLELENK